MTEAETGLNWGVFKKRERQESIVISLSCCCATNAMSSQSLNSISLRLDRLNCLWQGVFCQTGIKRVSELARWVGLMTGDWVINAFPNWTRCCLVQSVGPSYLPGRTGGALVDFLNSAHSQNLSRLERLVSPSLFTNQWAITLQAVKKIFWLFFCLLFN